ncbi:ATP-binding response regulator [Marinicella meishanensis]|uniref:ATP-binding response regulator n=1 Tax=Marinicella meishanensis TaxID=2873263 RepID=UPI001CC1B813|nr:ATP-binding protein [Marinicella sp. NBU2979]
MMIVALTLLLSAILALLVWLWTQLKKTRQVSHMRQALLDQLQAEQRQLDSAKADAEAANQAKNRYLSGISHELRTPLNVIMGYAQLLENQATEADPNHQKYRLMRQNCEHLAHLIEGILEFSAIESGKLKVQQDRFNLHELLANLRLMFTAQAEQKGLDFTYQQTSNLPQWVKTDHKRLQQILINLLSNAIKFTDQGQVDFIVKYRNQVVTFVIKDSGCGIQEGDLARIFKPFERIEHPQRRVSGTGLGLTITQLLVDLLGGDIQVSSTPGAGSLFSCQFMLSDQSQPATPADHASQTTEPAPLTKGQAKTLLLVDDEPAHRQLVADMLQPLGFTLLHATDAAAAQQLVNHPTQPPDIDLALLDVAMPGMDGWQLAAWLRSQRPTTKILMVSANPRDLQSNQHQSHDAYLTKPIKYEALLNQLNSLLDLSWHDQSPQLATPSQQPVSLPQEHWVALHDMADIGHIKGIENHLQRLYADELISAAEHRRLLQPIQHANLNQFRQLIQHETT